MWKMFLFGPTENYQLCSSSRLYEAFFFFFYQPCFHPQEATLSGALSSARHFFSVVCVDPNRAKMKVYMRIR